MAHGAHASQSKAASSSQTGQQDLQTTMERIKRGTEVAQDDPPKKRVTVPHMPKPTRPPPRPDEPPLPPVAPAPTAARLEQPEPPTGLGGGLPDQDEDAAMPTMPPPRPDEPHLPPVEPAPTVPRLEHTEPPSGIAGGLPDQDEDAPMPTLSPPRSDEPPEEPAHKVQRREQPEPPTGLGGGLPDQDDDAEKVKERTSQSCPEPPIGAEVDEVDWGGERLSPEDTPDNDDIPEYVAPRDRVDVFGFTKERGTGHVTLLDSWHTVRAFSWLINHRHQVLQKYRLGENDLGGFLLGEVSITSRARSPH